MAHGCGDELPRFGLSACYFHLKASALNGGFGRLSDEEREFVGVGSPITAGNSGSGGQRPDDGWRSPLAILIAELGGMPAADVARLEQLAGMDNPGQSRLEFLGG